MSTTTSDGRMIEVERVGNWPSEDPAYAEDSREDGGIFDGRAPTYRDLLDETAAAAAADEPWELYEITLYGEDGYAESGKRAEVLWLPGEQRAGVCFGGDSMWTDADSPEDAVRRVLDDEVIP